MDGIVNKSIENSYRNQTISDSVLCHSEVRSWHNSVYLRVPLGCVAVDVRPGDLVDVVVVKQGGVAVMAAGTVYKITKRAAVIYIPRSEHRHLVEELKQTGYALVQNVKKSARRQ
ncbi:hypothetical protein [Pyrobaculum sp.]|uniref:hypothetical protein n=1 Tax=Pyrobaculum sp. TaxID=2004705 RepID=UPI003D0EC321